MTPPKVPMLFAKQLGVHGQTVSKYNTGNKRPGLKTACQLAKLARLIPGQESVTILDWRPDLLEPETWSEIQRAVNSQKKKPKEFTDQIT